MKIKKIETNEIAAQTEESKETGVKVKTGIKAGLTSGTKTGTKPIFMCG